jgi:hypothetical protein
MRPGLNNLLSFLVTMGLMLMMMFFMVTFIYETTIELQSQLDIIKKLVHLQKQVIDGLLEVGK